MSIIVLGMVSLKILEKVCLYLQPLAMLITPTHDNKKEPISEEERLEISKKLVGHVKDFTIYTSSAIWGLMICKD